MRGLELGWWLWGGGAKTFIFLFFRLLTLCKQNHDFLVPPVYPKLWLNYTLNSSNNLDVKFVMWQVVEIASVGASLPELVFQCRPWILSPFPLQVAGHPVIARDRKGRREVPGRRSPLKGSELPAS